MILDIIFFYKKHVGERGKKQMNIPRPLGILLASYKYEWRTHINKLSWPEWSQLSPQKTGNVPNFETFSFPMVIDYWLDTKSSQSLRKHRCEKSLHRKRQQIPLGSVIRWNITKSLYIYIYVNDIHISLVIEPTRWNIYSSHWIISPAVKAEKLKPSPISLYLHVHTLHDTCIYKLSTISEDEH